MGRHHEGTTTPGRKYISSDEKYFLPGNLLPISTLKARYLPLDDGAGLTVGRPPAAVPKEGDYSALLAWRKGRVKKAIKGGLSSLSLSSGQGGQSSPPSLSQQLQGAQLSGPLDGLWAAPSRLATCRRRAGVMRGSSQLVPLRQGCV